MEKPEPINVLSSARVRSIRPTKFSATRGPGWSKSGGLLQVTLKKEAAPKDEPTGFSIVEISIIAVGLPSDEAEETGEAFRIETTIRATYAKPPTLSKDFEARKHEFDFAYLQIPYTYGVELIKEFAAKLGIGQLNIHLDVRDQLEPDKPIVRRRMTNAKPAAPVLANPRRSPSKKKNSRTKQ